MTYTGSSLGRVDVPILVRADTSDGARGDEVEETSREHMGRSGVLVVSEKGGRERGRKSKSPHIYNDDNRGMCLGMTVAREEVGTEEGKIKRAMKNLI